MLAVADGKKACAGATQTDHGKKKCSERIDAKIRADPRQSDG
jgi:hypothetical protein